MIRSRVAILYLALCFSLRPAAVYSQVRQQQSESLQHMSRSPWQSFSTASGLQNEPSQQRRLLDNKETPGMRERLATWFSGLAYLNPRFGGAIEQAKVDWETKQNGLSSLVVPSQTRPVEEMLNGTKSDSATENPFLQSEPNQPRAAEEGTQSSSPTVYTSNVDISSKGHSNKQPSSKGWRWRRSSTRSRQRDRHSKHESGDNTFSNKDSINLAESQQISASSSQPATVAAGIPLPKVALMFLTRGDMPYEHTWRHFLEAVPMKGASGQPDWQSMFSLYAHPGVNYSYPENSLFSGQAVEKREKVEWGQWSVMQAERNLMEAALEDPLNERFVLLSESCIPLYPAPMVWAQLLSEPRSRINACTDSSNPKDGERRMVYRMVNMEKDGLKKAHWRKSGQWIALVRKHAELVVNDTLISRLFKDECWVDSDHLSKGEPLWRFCVSDEHYIPTLLAFSAAEHETDCQGSVTNAWWDGPYFHPRTWAAQDISLELISKLRKTNNGFTPQGDLNCPSAQALRSARAIFPEDEGGLHGLSQGQKKRRLLHMHPVEAQQQDSHSLNQSAEAVGQSQSRVSRLRDQLDRRRVPDSLWMHLAVLQPGSLAWWELLDDHGINGDSLLEDAHTLQMPQSRARRLSADGGAPLEQGAHWDAARPLLAKYQPMADGGCPLFARKFSAHGADSVADLARRYTSLTQALADSSQQ